MERAIGVIDSGVGGLTVAHEIMRQLPNEEIIYLGDTKRCPYGPRPASEVKQFTFEMVEFLMKQNIKMIVVACNTATAFALEDLQNSFSIPVIGVIQPGARAAIKSTKNNKIGVIGTEGTIKSKAYPTALKKINQQLEVHSLACPMFVPIVEQGLTTGKEAKAIVEQSLQPFIENKSIDTLVLGCTHYPILESVIREVMGKDVQIISSSEETARETSAILEVHHLLYVGEREPKHQFYTTGDLNKFKQIYQTIFHENICSLESVVMKKLELT